MADEDKDLINSALKGDSAAFGKLYDNHASRMYRFIFLKTGHKSDTEDLLHEVFLAAWKNMGTYRAHDNIPFTSWLYQIARNRVIDYYRTRKLAVSLDEILAKDALPIELVSAPNALLTQALNKKMALEEIRGALKLLNEDHQNIIIMRFVEDLSPQEIATAMEKTPGAVRVLQHRALQQLKKRIEQLHGQRIPYTTS